VKNEKERFNAEAAEIEKGKARKAFHHRGHGVHRGKRRKTGPVGAY
jgi:hypothetical protein